MFRYLSWRLLLLPVTLFLIVLVNFVIINLAPGEPVTITEQNSRQGALRSQKYSQLGVQDQQYEEFRQYFGLTLPILWNTWPWYPEHKLLQDLEKLETRKDANGVELTAKEFSELKLKVRDRAYFCMDTLLSISENPRFRPQVRYFALLFFLQGGQCHSIIGPNLSLKQKEYNERIQKNTIFLEQLRSSLLEDSAAFSQTIVMARKWYTQERLAYPQKGSWKNNLTIFFLDTRFAKYMQKVLTLDFGTLRNDTSKTVLSEVIARLKYSLTLTIIPMFISFVLCQLFGLIMAIKQFTWIDYTLNVLFLIAWATPIFVLAPFLINKIALHHNYPFTDIPFPIHGFSSDDAVFVTLSTWGKVKDVIRHLTLPIFCILVSSLAVDIRLSRAVIAEVLRKEYITLALAKGLPSYVLYGKHVAKNAAIPIVCSISSSFGAILGGSIIIETIFEIHGFGLFFYEAVVNRDYNVMMFSALVGSFLALVGYVIADVLYMLLDPRIRLEAEFI